MWGLEGLEFVGVVRNWDQRIVCWVAVWGVLYLLQEVGVAVSYCTGMLDIGNTN